MHIRFAESEEDCARVHPVMVQLRNHLDRIQFIQQVKRQSQDGYRIVYLEDKAHMKTVAGFRIYEMLARGRHLYVDDLVTDGAERSKGYGAMLLDWLIEYARANGCSELHLDSAVQRKEAHLFYVRRGLEMSAYHFRKKLALDRKSR